MTGNPLDNRPALFRWGAIGALVTVSVVLVVRALPNEEPPPKDQPTLRAKVKRVYDGRKIKLETDEKVVYAGIRTPLPKEPFHTEAASRNTELVEDKKVRLRFGQQEKTREGHLLAYIFIDDECINETLVREGLAYVRLTPTTRRFAEKLLLAQVEARKAKRGIWSGNPPAPESHYPADPKYGNFHRPGCQEVPKIKPERRVTLKSRKQAYSEGYAPCSRCGP